jgi:hypothetical protein
MSEYPGAGHQVNGRRRLPNRRAAVAFELEHAALRFRAHVGFFDGGTLAEVFLDAAKPNSSIDAFASDAAILISLLLQRGAPLDEIGHALRRDFSGAPASLIGTVIDELSKLALDMIEGAAE